MNDINEMPPKCQYCPYWEVCKYPWVCLDIGDKKPKTHDKRTETHACDLISRKAAISALDEIRHALWEIDIPSPTVPEYIEHHEQVQSVWKLLDKKQKELYVMPSVQPYTDEDIQKLQNIEQAQFDKIRELAYQEGKADAMRWIPCSERLPEHSGIYLVTLTVAVEKYVVVRWYSQRGGWISDEHPEAWMPLPEPYKEVE